MYLIEKEILQRTNKTNIKGSLIERPGYVHYINLKYTQTQRNIHKKILAVKVK